MYKYYLVVQIVADEGFNGSVYKFVETLYNDPKQYFPSKVSKSRKKIWPQIIYYL